MNRNAGLALITLRTLAAGAAGGWLFNLLNLPVAWLSGSMTAVAALAITGRAVLLPQLLCDAGLFLAGISLGSTVTSEALAAIARYPFSIVILVLSIGGIVFTSMILLEKLFGWDRQTAFLSSVPGALTMTLALAVQTGADAGRVAVVQSIRLFVLVALLPLFIAGSAAGIGQPGQPVMTPAALAVVCLAGLMLDLVLTRLGAITPVFLGAMFASTGLHLADLVPGVVPEPAVVLSFLLMGVYCGVRFEGTSLRLLAGMLAPGLVSLLAVLTTSLIAAWAVHQIVGVPLPEALVALAPGGVEAMILIGASLGLDTLYISTHHVARLLVLNAFTPVFVPSRRGT